MVHSVQGKKILLTAVLSLLILTGFLSSPSASAQITNSISLRISPATFELKADPGNTISKSLDITNISTATLTITAHADDFIVEGTEGHVTLEEQNQDPSAFSKMFKFDIDKFDLTPNQTFHFNFTINVAKTAEPGGQFATILFQSVPKGTPEGSGASTIQRLGALVLMTVSGDIVEKGNIKDFYPKKFTGTWEEVSASDGVSKILVAQNEDLKNNKVIHYFNKGVVAFNVVFKNDGNVYYRPAGDLTITNIFGKKVAQLPLNGQNVFPGGERRITAIWPKRNLWGIYYKAHISAVFGSKNLPLSADTTFWAFPLWAAIALAALIVLIIIFRRRLRKVLRVIIKG